MTCVRKWMRDGVLNVSSITLLLFGWYSTTFTISPVLLQLTRSPPLEQTTVLQEL